LAARGASFWLDFVGATGGAGDDAVLAALWDLVWAGEVTNDTLAPLRALLSRRPRAPSRSGRPRLGRLTRLGPPTGAGRWSLVAPMLDPRPSPTEVAHARALQLLDRHGVLTREAVGSEGVPGGFAGVYAVGRALEEQGRTRRGYFVAGLGAAQFALPGAVERLRSVRDASTDRPALVALAATDPAQPYGAALPWPESGGRPARAAGAYVVLADGAAAAYLERGARSVVTFGDAAADGRWIGALVDLVKDGRVPKLELARVDGVAARESPWADHLRELGFVDGYKGLVMRA
jgi:ATP-dependent Lhr-like helicase